MFLFLIFSSFCNMMSSEEFSWIANICRDMKYLRSLGGYLICWPPSEWLNGLCRPFWSRTWENFYTLTSLKIFHLKVYCDDLFGYFSSLEYFSVLVYFSDGYFNFWIFCHLRLCHFEQEEVLGYSELFLASEN